LLWMQRGAIQVVPPKTLELLKGRHLYELALISCH